MRILYPFLPIICPALCTHLRSISFHSNSIRFEDVLCGSHVSRIGAYRHLLSETLRMWAKTNSHVLSQTHLINHSIKNMFDSIERERASVWSLFRFVSSQIELVRQKLIYQKRAGRQRVHWALKHIDRHRRANHCFDRRRFPRILNENNNEWMSEWVARSYFERVRGVRLMWFHRLIRLIRLFARFVILS